MKDNKGFTLVEMLAVVVILIAVIAIITPKIISSFNNAEETIYNQQIESIVNISKIYMNKNSNLLPEGAEKYIITIEKLSQEKLITDEEILNPKTQQPLTGCVVVQYINNKYQYEYIEDETICND